MSTSTLLALAIFRASTVPLDQREVPSNLGGLSYLTLWVSLICSICYLIRNSRSEPGSLGFLALLEYPTLMEFLTGGLDYAPKETLGVPPKWVALLASKSQTRPCQYWLQEFQTQSPECPVDFHGTRIGTLFGWFILKDTPAKQGKLSCNH